MGIKATITTITITLTINANLMINTISENKLCNPLRVKGGC